MDYDQTIQKYCMVMEEIKRRTAAVSIAMKQSVFSDEVTYEISFVQFRMICELIALACLVAHNDVPTIRSKFFVKSADATKTMTALEKLHPDFYPRPGQQFRLPDGQIGVAPIESGYLTKDRLRVLYAKTGDVLHRGSFKRLFEPPTSISRDEILQWQREIITLLNHHQITLFDPKHEIWVLMQTDPGGHVSGHLMEFKGFETPEGTLIYPYAKK